MKNLITELQKAIENGQTLMSKSGDLVQESKMDDTLQKAYVTGLKGKSINFDETFKDYKKKELANNYFSVEVLTKNLEAMLKEPITKEISAESQQEEPDLRSYEAMTADIEQVVE